MLNASQRRLLQFETAHEHTPGEQKFPLVYQEFRITLVTYYQRLHVLLHSRDAAREFPELVRHWFDREEHRRAS